jgi:hypothetical protein
LFHVRAPAHAPAHAPAQVSATFAGAVTEAAQRGHGSLTSDAAASGGALGALAAFLAAVALQSVLEYVRAHTRLPAVLWDVGGASIAPHFAPSGGGAR